MSDTEIMPEPHVLHVQPNGLASFRPAATTLTVDALPDEGRLLTASADGHRIAFSLNAEQARHIAALLR